MLGSDGKPIERFSRVKGKSALYQGERIVATIGEEQ